MDDMDYALIPNSLQLNADDLLGGKTLTIKITKVIVRKAATKKGEQLVTVNYEGDNDKPYLPCKSMCRVMVHVWGKDSATYVGKSMTLYCDPEVMFGGVKTGGIRISHMSGLDEPKTMALTATRANRKPFTVKPLATTSEPTIDADKLKVEAQAAAEKGTAALQAFWGTLKKPQQAALKGALDGYKTIASGVDAKTEGCSDEEESAS